MKARKRLEFSSLMNEVIEALKLFKPSPQTIKSTIEKLIQQEFLARDKDDKTALLYVP
jgi:predicted transcriptional regulator